MKMKDKANLRSESKGTTGPANTDLSSPSLQIRGVQTRGKTKGCPEWRKRKNILLLTESVMELMGFCHFPSCQSLLNRGLCIQKDH